MSDLSKGVEVIVRQTREKLLPFWGNIEASHNKGRGASDVVTKLDLEIEQFLAEKLKGLDPTIEFAGEEFGGSRNSERFWLCDPIDGTAHFIRGLPFCTVMLALIENQQVTLSFIYDFVNDDLYHAERGRGAYKNDIPIHVSDRPFANAYVGCETHLDKQENLEKYFGLGKHASLFKSLCSGYEFAMVASGKLDGRIQFDGFGKDWDFAPGSLLVEEAGGIVANIGTNSYNYSNLDFIATNKTIFDALTTGPDAVFPIE